MMQLPKNTRRMLFGNAATGLGGAGVAWMLHASNKCQAAQTSANTPRFRSKAKRIIHIFLPGGVFQCLDEH
ncbi:MAG: hypothetical protein H6822_14985 [Planctomycetaceae bacterium]|nr:hypothetical protein [Planctomycetales bacterium]MCB9923485.1 hypothetical protein [Planctomycetaceae bacterium]